MRLAGAVAAALALALAGAAQAQVAPRVVVTSPTNGARVPPSVAELKVSYDHRMAASWSFATGGEKAFPEVEGQPSLSDDAITISLPIRLEPRKTYVVWLNSDRYKNFKGEDGVPAEPYRLTFSTTD
ncbi:MAG: Ig-like domain-containing protein [Phenylobacterium sp.]